MDLSGADLAMATLTTATLLDVTLRGSVAMQATLALPPHSHRLAARLVALALDKLTTHHVSAQADFADASISGSMGGRLADWSNVDFTGAVFDQARPSCPRARHMLAAWVLC